MSPNQTQIRKPDTSLDTIPKMRKVCCDTPGMIEKHCRSATTFNLLIELVKGLAPTSPHS